MLTYLLVLFFVNSSHSLECDCPSYPCTVSNCTLTCDCEHQEVTITGAVHVACEQCRNSTFHVQPGANASFACSES